MRALRRIATPASVAVVIGGCTYPFDDYLPRKTDAGLAANRPDTAPEPFDDGARDSGGFDSGVFALEDADAPTDDTSGDDAEETSGAPDTATADTMTAPDTLDTPDTPDTFIVADTHTEPKDAPVDTCVCIKVAGGKCKEWWPPGCGS